MRFGLILLALTLVASPGCQEGQKPNLLKRSPVAIEDKKEFGTEQLPEARQERGKSPEETKSKSPNLDQ